MFIAILKCLDGLWFWFTFVCGLRCCFVDCRVLFGFVCVNFVYWCIG